MRRLAAGSPAVIVGTAALGAREPAGGGASVDPPAASSSPGPLDLAHERPDRRPDLGPVVLHVPARSDVHVAVRAGVPLGRIGHRALVDGSAAPRLVGGGVVAVADGSAGRPAQRAPDGEGVDRLAAVGTEVRVRHRAEDEAVVAVEGAHDLGVQIANDGRGRHRAGGGGLAAPSTFLGFLPGGCGRRRRSPSRGVATRIDEIHRDDRGGMIAAAAVSRRGEGVRAAALGAGAGEAPESLREGRADHRRAAAAAAARITTAEARRVRVVRRGDWPSTCRIRSR